MTNATRKGSAAAIRAGEATGIGGTQQRCEAETRWAPIRAAETLSVVTRRVRRSPSRGGTADATRPHRSSIPR